VSETCVDQIGPRAVELVSFALSANINRTTHLGRGHDRKGAHHPVRELFPDLGDQERTHTGPSSTSQRVGDLEPLETVGPLGFLSDDIEDLVDELGSFSVVTLGPVVSGTGLSVDHVIGPEEVSQGAALDRVHSTGLQVDQDGTGDVPAQATERGGCYGE
jgi:hypothetical protein